MIATKLIEELRDKIRVYNDLIPILEEFNQIRAQAPVEDKLSGETKALMEYFKNIMKTEMIKNFIIAEEMKKIIKSGL